MIKYSIIIPVYDRPFELSCCLARLNLQSHPKEQFEIIICDDGSTEDTMKLVRHYDPLLNIKYLWQPDKGFRAGQARNMGAKISLGQNLVFLDSDIIVRENWLSSFDVLSIENPECIICGRYDFLWPQKLVVENIINDFDKVVSNGFPITHRPKGELLGADIRKGLFEKYKEQGEPMSGCGGAMFGGNTLVPKSAFNTLGGFDEYFVSHGGEDNDAGQTLDELGYKFIFSEKMMAWHIYHSRNQSANVKALFKNIRYIDAKHKGSKP